MQSVPDKRDTLVIHYNILVFLHKCGGSMVERYVLVAPVVVAPSDAGRTYMIPVWTCRLIATFFSYIRGGNVCHHPT